MKVAGAVGLFFMHVAAMLAFAASVYFSFAVFHHWWPIALVVVVLLPVEAAILVRKTRSRGFTIPSRQSHLPSEGGDGAT